MLPPLTVAVLGAAWLNLKGDDAAVYMGSAPQTAKLTASCEAAEPAFIYLSPRSIGLSGLSTFPPLRARLGGVPPSCAGVRSVSEPCATDDPDYPSLYWCQYAVATSEQLVLGPVQASYTAQMAGGRLVGLQTHVDCELPSRAALQTLSGIQEGSVNVTLVLRHGVQAGSGSEIGFFGVPGGNMVEVDITNYPPSPPSIPPPAMPPSIPSPSPPAAPPTIIAFTDSGTHSWDVPMSCTTVQVLIVAGGGGGAYDCGGGGGAGGLINQPTRDVTPGSSIVVKVGAGGDAGTTASRAGVSGSNSEFGVDANGDPVLVALGGGGGADGNMAGLSGGSGGGCRSGYAGSSGEQPSQPYDSGSYGFGHGGGSCMGNTGGGGQGGSGGGGAGGAGEDHSGDSLPTVGGAGLDLSSTWGTTYGRGGKFAGGGTSAADGTAECRSGCENYGKGFGGGGSCQDGVDGTGGGGGASSGACPSYVSGRGGHGIVLVLCV